MVRLRAGIARLEYDGGPLPFLDTELTKAFADVELAYYPLENLMVSGSCEYVFDNALARGQVEYLTGFRGLALYADAAVGENRYDHILLGVRWYFGGSKSLKAHHRQDDPRDFTPTILYGIGTYGAEFNRNARDYARAHQSDDGGAGGGDGGGGYGVIDTAAYGAYGACIVFDSLPPNLLITEQ